MLTHFSCAHKPFIVSTVCFLYLSSVHFADKLTENIEQLKMTINEIITITNCVHSCEYNCGQLRALIRANKEITV